MDCVGVLGFVNKTFGCLFIAPLHIFIIQNVVLSLTEMFINSTIGSTLNCGFCRTVVYECLTTKRDDKQKSDSRSKTSESKEGANKTVSFNVMCLCKKWMVRRLQMARRHVYPSSLRPCFVVPSLRWVIYTLTRIGP